MLLFLTLWTVALQAPLSMGSSEQEYWTGLPCPPAGDLPDPGIEPASHRSPALSAGYIYIVKTLCYTAEIKQPWKSSILP